MACIGDKAFYDGFGGVNDPDAVMEAQNFMAAMMEDLIAKYEINIFSNINQGVYSYQINIVSVDVITDDYPLYIPDGAYKKLAWNKFSEFWNEKYPCADGQPDIIHVFSGYLVSQDILRSAGKIFQENPSCTCVSAD